MQHDKEYIWKIYIYTVNEMSLSTLSFLEIIYLHEM